MATKVSRCASIRYAMTDTALQDGIVYSWKARALNPRARHVLAPVSVSGAHHGRAIEQTLAQFKQVSPCY
jgi:hypothetical protein